jgi:hypothetical protein
MVALSPALIPRAAGMAEKVNSPTGSRFQMLLNIILNYRAVGSGLFPTGEPRDS